MKNRVVITGLGTINSIGKNIKEFWTNCLNSKTNVSPIPEDWEYFTSFNSRIWSPLPEIDYSEFNINRIKQKQLDHSSLMALAASKQAIENAHLTIQDLNNKQNTYQLKNTSADRSGVIIGTGVGGISSLASCYTNQILSKQHENISKLKSNVINQIKNNEEIENDFNQILNHMYFPKRFNPFAVSMIMPNAVSSNIAIQYHLNGLNQTINSACASGTMAIGTGFNAVKNGELDLAIIGGSEYFYDDYGALFYGFDLTKALTHNYQSPESANRPFDKDRNGFLYSQGGCGILVIETLENALKRDVEILAEIHGYAETCDGHNIMMMEPNGDQIKIMLQNLCHQTGIAPERIDYINAHGTGTQLNDETESKIIDEIFGKKVLVNSTKSLLGHTFGASGAIEAVVTALSLKEQTTHICNNLQNPIRDLNFVTKKDSFNIQYAITQSFGFGGHNAALLLSRYQG